MSAAKALLLVGAIFLILSALVISGLIMLFRSI